MGSKYRTTKKFLLLLVVLAGIGCSSSMEPTQYFHPQFDFSHVEKVAVLPLENLSSDRQAGARATRLLITELLASGAVDVVEPGEVTAVRERVVPGRSAPTTEGMIDLGLALEVQAIVLGSVSQSEIMRSGTVANPVVTLDLHMVETETGTTVWAATHTEKGAGLSSKFLGTGGEPISETTRRCVRRLVESLVQ